MKTLFNDIKTLIFNFIIINYPLTNRMLKLNSTGKLQFSNSNIKIVNIILNRRPQSTAINIRVLEYMTKKMMT